MSILAVMAPLPSRRTPSRLLWTRPASRSTASVIFSPAFRRLSSIAFWMRLRFTSEKSLAKMLRKPRLGMRMCSGIWPPSKPCTWLPVRALAPLTPRPEVLPRPEEEPRPSLALRLRAPGLLAIWLSFILLALFHHFDEVLDGVDHAADGGRVFQGAGAANLAETQATQGCGLDVRLAVGAADLAHRYRLTRHRLPGFRFLLSHDFSLSACIRIPRRSGLRGGPGFPTRCGHGAGPP